MKKITIFIFFAILIAYDCSAQNDTLAQQRQIQDSIQKYIGKAFSILYNDMIIKPKSISGVIAPKNIYTEWAHFFYYTEVDSKDDESDIYIYIEWQSAPLKTETRKMQPYSLRIFNAQEYPTYKDLIIKKLKVYPKQL